MYKYVLNINSGSTTGCLVCFKCIFIQFILKISSLQFQKHHNTLSDIYLEHNRVQVIYHWCRERTVVNVVVRIKNRSNSRNSWFDSKTLTEIRMDFRNISPLHSDHGRKFCVGGDRSAFLFVSLVIIEQHPLILFLFIVYC